jgi:hypothetical protein
VLLSKHRLKAFATDLFLWNSIQSSPKRISIPEGLVLDTTIPEPVRWLYGRFNMVPPVTWAPDIILTSNPADAVGPTFDAQRR